MLLNPMRGMPTKLCGIGAKVEIDGSPFRGRLEDVMAHIYRSEAVPLRWSKAFSAWLNKGNGKKQFQGVRSIHTFEALGQLWYKAIWARGETAKKPFHFDYAYAYRNGMRREAPMNT